MNPSNNGTYTGVVCKPPIFIRNKQGVDFQARFVLQVRRAYKNKEGKTFAFVSPRNPDDFIAALLKKNPSIAVVR